MFLVYKLLNLDHIYVTLKLRFISIKNKLSSFFYIFTVRNFLFGKLHVVFLQSSTINFQKVFFLERVFYEKNILF